MGAPVVTVDPNGHYVGPTTAGGTAVSGNSPAGTADTGAPVKVGGVYNSTLPTYTTGQRGDLQISARGVLFSTIASPSGGTAQVSSNSGDATPAQSALFVINQGAVFNGTNWDRARGDTFGAWVVDAPSSAATVALTPNANGTVNSANTIKGSAGNLYRLNVVAGATPGYVMVFDATTAPADGAVTPKWVMPVAASAGINQGFSPPMRMTVGCTIVFSTTGPYTKTASATAFIGGTCV